jgi:hypothetical protein
MINTDITLWDYWLLFHAGLHTIPLEELAKQIDQNSNDQILKSEINE